MADDDKTKKIEAKEKELKARSDALDKREKDLDEISKALEAREKELNGKEKALAKNKPAGRRGVEEEKKELSEADKKLISKACKAFGIEDKFVFASGIQDRDGKPEAIVVTNGGKKVRYIDGDEVVPLSDVEITGISPKKPKVVAGKEKGGKGKKK